MKQLYSIDVRVVATAYIRADSAEEATRIAREMKDEELFVRNAYKGDGTVVIDNSAFENAMDVSLWPVMTLVGPYEGDTASEVD